MDTKHVICLFSRVQTSDVSFCFLLPTDDNNENVSQLQVKAIVLSHHSQAAVLIMSLCIFFSINVKLSFVSFYQCLAVYK